MAKAPKNFIQLTFRSGNPVCVNVNNISYVSKLAMTSDDYNLMTVMFRIIMGYCLINNKDDYDCLSKKVIDNYKDIIDELMLQGIFKEPNDDNFHYGFRYEYKLEELSIYITNRLENDYQKEIR